MAVRLPSGICILIDVTPATVRCADVADLAHGLFDQGRFDRHQCAGGHRCRYLLLSQARCDGRYDSQIIGVALQFAVPSGGCSVVRRFHVADAELPHGALQIAKGVGGDLGVCPDADEGQLAGGGMVDGLAIEATADPGAEMFEPFGQCLGRLDLDLVGFVRSVGGFDVGHAQVVFGQQSLGMGGGQGGFMLVAGICQSQQFFDLFNDGVGFDVCSPGGCVL